MRRAGIEVMSRTHELMENKYGSCEEAMRNNALPSLVNQGGLCELYLAAVAVGAVITWYMAD